MAQNIEKETKMSLEKFKALGLSEITLAEIKKKGFEEPTEIQEKTIPVLLSEDIDFVGQAQTGTGKTAAFGLPLLELMKENAGKIQALILVPTRELAIQVAEEINSFKGKRKFQIIPIYGGQSMPDQLARLKKGVDVVVGTPGRVYDHIRRKSMILDQVSYVILDEVDEMLNMGFVEEVEVILEKTNPDRRTLIFSATIPDRIIQIAKKYMKEYKIIALKKGQMTVDLTDQIYFEVSPGDRFEALCRIIDVEKDFYGLIFCRTKVSVDELTNMLINRGYDAEGIHSDLSQHQRERILEKFKSRRINILAATDVAARGIDVMNLTHVINYALPQNADSYIHRIGRTGRAGKKGIAITFISPDENRKLIQFTRITKTAIRKEKIPKAAEIVKIKRSRIESELNQIIQQGDHEEYITAALNMLEINDPVDVIAALFKYSLEDELSEKRYKEIKEFKNVSVDNKGTARLFISLGKKDGITPKKLTKMINNQAKVRAGNIREIKVMDSFSFLSVTFKEAEIILNAFKDMKGEKRPIVSRATGSPQTKKNDRSKKSRHQK
ncbi:MAG: DEAD/DEAH box helicase [Spirochaetes bacterium]|nr:DEAD/DEAH box helicase [Spirochaetota bacterium]